MKPIYNYENIICYVEEMAKNEIEVMISIHNLNGDFIGGKGHIYGRTEISVNGDVFEVVVVGLGDDLKDAFGMRIETFLSNVTPLVEIGSYYHNLYLRCFTCSDELNESIAV